ncbi:MAG: hypothetical protein KAJ29_01590, partial [Alphaproteobacteria bacterium]|nr:hypothetical protein [Alphaproteobacteria bacterium]
MFHRFFFLSALLVFLVSFTTPANAYIGPAIVILSSILGPVVAILVVVILTLFFPVLKLYRKLKTGSKKDQNDQEKSKQDEETQDKE